MIRPVLALTAAFAATTASHSSPRLPALSDTASVSGVIDSVSSAASVASGANTQQLKIPFKVGERADYDVKFGSLRVGSAYMEVVGVENIRNRSAWHTMFRVQGGTFFYKVDDIFESWIDQATFSSLRFHSELDEGPNERSRRFEIYPEKGTYLETTKKGAVEQKSVNDPLDDGSFLFFVRSVPLEVGKTYEFNRYFRPDRNPVTIKVLRKETIQVPAGKFQCIVVQPIIKTKGIFSENGRAEVWLSDDSRRIVVQLKSKLSFGSINLYLKKYKEGT
jgi:hypothetical protein